MNARDPSPPSAQRRLGPVLRGLRYQWFGDPETAFAAVSPTAAIKHFRSLADRRNYFHYLAHLPIGRAHLMGSGSSDVEFGVEFCPSIHLVTCFAGTRQARTPTGQVTCGKGGMFLLPPGEREVSGANSFAIVTLQPQEIAHAAKAMACGGETPDPATRRWLAFSPRAWGPGFQARQVRALVEYIDACAAVEPSLPARLALDDVLHRQVAALLDPSLLLEGPADRERLASREGKSAFDDLIDYIRANLDQPLRLSDLEARSRYSRQALLHAFRQKLNCSPKQWIRQQRLQAALEQLKTPQGAVSLQRVALSCGYRSLNHFNRDFYRQFGLEPSQLCRPVLGCEV